MQSTWFYFQMELSKSSARRKGKQTQMETFKDLFFRVFKIACYMRSNGENKSSLCSVRCSVARFQILSLNCKLIRRLKIDFLPLPFRGLGKVSAFISSLAGRIYICVCVLLQWAHSDKQFSAEHFMVGKFFPREFVEKEMQKSERKNGNRGQKVKRKPKKHIKANGKTKAKTTTMTKKRGRVLWTLSSCTNTCNCDNLLERSFFLTWLQPQLLFSPFPFIPFHSFSFLLCMPCSHPILLVVFPTQYRWMRVWVWSCFFIRGAFAFDKLLATYILYIYYIRGFCYRWATLLFMPQWRVCVCLRECVSVSVHMIFDVRVWMNEWVRLLCLFFFLLLFSMPYADFESEMPALSFFCCSFFHFTIVIAFARAFVWPRCVSFVILLCISYTYCPCVCGACVCVCVFYQPLATLLIKKYGGKRMYGDVEQTNKPKTNDQQMEGKWKERINGRHGLMWHAIAFSIHTIPARLNI